MRNLSFGIVAVGANLSGDAGTPHDQVIRALMALQAHPDIALRSVSRIWRTPAHPSGSGPDFANACCTLCSILGPDPLLQLLHDIENALGRDRSTGRWGARVVDLDLLALDDRILPDRACQRAWATLSLDRQPHEAPDRLILPHPRLQDRGFVLAPLADIAPGWRHPVDGRSVARMLADLGPAALAGMTPQFPAFP